jgi:hypothetical protein
MEVLMRNKFPGVCYRCGKIVSAGDGHFERHLGKWRTQHASCAIQARSAKKNADVLAAPDADGGVA